jgi:hypothetical protein
MTTIHETSSTVQFDTALRQMADRARTRYAGEAARIDRALVIALNGGVTLHQDGTASVQSCSRAEVVYHVAHGTCDCPDFSRAPEGRCKHRYAVCLAKKAQVQVASSPGRPTYYATYTTPDGLVLQGTAQWVEDDAGWLFIDETDQAYLTQRAHALVLGGNVAILEAQRVADGNLAAKVCGYSN